jgi:ADP-heptose:LPS heptosyltransferase
MKEVLAHSRNDTHSPSKIAIFRALYLGDMLCIIPTVRAIRKAWPQTEMTLIGLPWQVDFARRFSHYFNSFIEFPGWPGLPEQKPDKVKIVRFLEQVRKEHFDIIFQLHGNGMITNSMCLLWGGEKVCGLRREGANAPDMRLFPVSEDGEHEILRFFKILDALAIPQRGTHLEFPITEEENARFEDVAERTGISPQGYVCLHPGARDSRRRWPAENFAFLANYIAAQGFSIVLTGSSEEKALLKELQEQIKEPVINIVETFGHLSAGELAAVLKHAALLVSNDTGVSHIAAALSIASIILFSPYSDINRWRPINAEQHLAIPFEKASDRQFVLQRVLQRLMNFRPKESLKSYS